MKHLDKIKSFPLLYAAALENHKDYPNGKCYNVIFEKNASISEAFEWSLTEQRYAFWSYIDNSNFDKAKEMIPGLFEHTQSVTHSDKYGYPWNKHLHYENGRWWRCPAPPPPTPYNPALLHDFQKKALNQIAETYAIPSHMINAPSMSPPPPSPLRDKNGEIWHPEFHSKTHALNSDGTWKKLRVPTPSSLSKEVEDRRLNHHMLVRDSAFSIYRESLNPITPTAPTPPQPEPVSLFTDYNPHTGPIARFWKQ